MTTTAGGASIRNVVITRSKEGNEELSVRLKRAGFNPISVNTISLSPPKDWSVVDGFLQRLHSFDWLVFTSATGVEYFDMRMKALSLQLPWHGKPLVAAVGERTADKVTGIGVKPSFIPSSYTTKKLAEELQAGDGNRVLLLRADSADPNLSERLKERGYKVEETAIYRTQIAVESSRTGKELRDADIIVFASPSAVRGFCGTISKDEMAKLQRIRAICIGPVTEAAAKEDGFTNTIVPKSYTLEAVVEELERLSQRYA